MTELQQEKLAIIRNRLETYPYGSQEYKLCERTLAYLCAEIRGQRYDPVTPKPVRYIFPPPSRPKVLQNHNPLYLPANL